MRSAGDIKRGLLDLRFSKKLPLKKIADDSGCSVPQVIAALQLDATETVQRRLDAYLDAGKMHVHTEDTKRTFRIEQLSRECWNLWKLHTIPMRDVYLLPPERQKRLEAAITWRLKRALREYIKAKFGYEPKLADSASYWRAKAKICAKHGAIEPAAGAKAKVAA